MNAEEGHIAPVPDAVGRELVACVTCGLCKTVRQVRALTAPSCLENANTGCTLRVSECTCACLAARATAVNCSVEKAVGLQSALLEAMNAAGLPQILQEQ